MQETKGYMCMVLHAHLPFVYHPENDNFFEESWLFEAISETYIPLLTNFKKLVSENVEFRLTLTMTPTLLNMLDNSGLQEKYIRYLEKHIELCKKEIERTKHNYQENELAKYYLDRYTSDLHIFRDIYNCNLISGFKFLQDVGVLEIIACAATHGYLPILYLNEKNIEAQIRVGVETYQKYFEKQPRGFWIPECGYVPEIENYLVKYGIEYFITEMHGVLYANPLPVYGTLAPITTPNGLSVFGRDIEASMRIWSYESGYPGDPNYRDLYRDLAYDAEYEYIKPYTYNGTRMPIGIKYYSVSDKASNNKNYYNLTNAKETAERHAYHFMQVTIEQINRNAKYMNGKKPIILSAQDAELYGHWWYEGPYWLYILMKKIYYDQNEIELITPSEYIDKYPIMQECKPCISSWGAGGNNTFWTIARPAEIYIHIHFAGDRMCELANKFINEKDEIKIRALNQCARELFLMQSSDWLWQLAHDSMQEYVYLRFEIHIKRFNKLYEQINNDNIDIKYLSEAEKMDCIFSEIDYRIYSDNK